MAVQIGDDGFTGSDDNRLRTGSRFRNIHAMPEAEFIRLTGSRAIRRTVSVSAVGPASLASAARIGNLRTQGMTRYLIQFKFNRGPVFS